MAQPLPRTDTGEVEVLQAVPSVQNSTAPGRIAAWIRFWSKGERGFEPVRVSAQSDSVLVQMISDLVIADGGRLEPEPPHALVGRFQSPIQAVTVAKRIHRCVSVFAAEAKVSSSVGIAISTLQEGVQDSSRIQALLEAALPGRVVVPEDLCRQLQAVPGIPLRTPGPAGLARTDQLRELMWTPIPGYKDNRPLPKLVSLSTSETTEAGLDTDLPVAAGPRSHEIPKTFPSAKNQDIFATEEDEPGYGISNPIRAVLYAAGILVLVFAILLILSSRRNSTPGAHDARSKAPAAPQGKAPSSSPNTGTKPLEPSTAEPPQTDQAKTSPSAGPPADSPVAKAPEPKSDQTPPQSTSKPQGQDSQVSQQKPPSCSGFFPAQIEDLLGVADQDFGMGKYQEAIREYRLVQCLDPRNTRARAGVDKANRASQLSPEN